MDRLVEFGVEFMTKRGVPEESASYLSKTIVETEAFRQTTHGLAQFQAIHSSLGKTIDPEAVPTVVHQRGATALVDGDRCFGNLAMRLAKTLAVKMARAQGIGFVAVRNSAWVGALGVHLISIAREGMLVQACAQTNTCKDCAPFGGSDARFSTNPVALAFPTATDPVVADFSTAAMSMSAANALVTRKQKTATHRFIDSAGNPSDDASVIRNGGTLMFMGGDTEGHKGYALSLFNEALTVLAGGSANNPEAESHQAFSIMVLSPAAFAGAEYYSNEMSRFIRHLKSSRVRPGFEAVRLPGERGFAALADCEANGIPLDDVKLEMLLKIAEENGIASVA